MELRCLYGINPFVFRCGIGGYAPARGNLLHGKPFFG